MRPRNKKILAVLAVALTLVVVALLVAPRFIDANSFRPALEKMARERLGRDVAMGELGVSFLPPSITVKDVSIAGSEGGEPWVAAKGVRVRAAWTGLLSGNLKVEGIALDAPRVRLLRSPDGKWNVLEMIGSRQEASRARSVTVDRIAVRDGHVEIADAFVAPGQVVRLVLDDVDASVGGIGSDRGWTVDAAAAIQGAGKASWTGRVGPGNTLDGHASTQALDVASIAPYLAQHLHLPAIEGIVTSELDVTRADTGTSARGKVSVERFRLPTLSSVAGATAKAGVEIVTDGHGHVDVKRFDLESGQTKLSARGDVADSPQEQVVTLELDAPKLALKDVAALLAAAGQSLPLTGLSGDATSMSGKARIVRRGEPRQVESVALDGVEIRGLRVGLRKGQDGAWHLLGSQPAPEKQAESRMPLRVRDLHVSDAALRLEDATVSPPTSVEITDVAARIASWAPGEAGDVDITARVASGSVSLHGRVSAPGPGASPWDARLQVKDVDLAQAGALASAAGLRPKAGRADWDAQITGTPGVDLGARGKLSLHGAKLPLEGGREITLDLPIDHDVTLLDQGRIQLSALTLGLPGGPLTLQGRVQRGDALRYDVGTSGAATLSPQAVSWLVALLGEKLPFDLELSEPLTIDARARNAGAGLELSGRASLAKARIRTASLDQPLEIARAAVEMRGDRLEISDASIRLGASAMQGSLAIEDFEHPQATFDLSSPEADLDELFGILSRSHAQAASPDAVPLSQRLRAHGRLRVDHATFGGVELTAFDSTVDMREGRILFDPAQVALYGGKGGGRAAFDLSSPKPRFDADVALDGVDVHALLAAGMGYQDLSGRGKLDARLHGEAGSLDEALAALGGEGTLHLQDGEIGKLNALGALEKASVFGEQSFSTLAGRLSREGTAFSTLDGRFTIQSGQIRIEDATLVAPDANIDAQGVATFAEKSVDVQSIIAFSEALSQQMRGEGSRAAQLFWDPQKNRVILPARISGTPGAMKATIDWKAAGSQILKSGALSSILQGVAGGATGPSGATGPKPSPAGGLLDAILGGGKAPAPAPASATAAPAADSSLPRAGDPPIVTIDQARMGGNFLTPDLKLRATLKGARLSHGVVIVRSPAGEEIARDDHAFESQVAEFYAAAPRDQPAAIPVKLTVDFQKLGGMGPFVVAVRPVDDAGRQGEEVRADVEKASPF